MQDLARRLLDCVAAGLAPLVADVQRRHKRFGLSQKFVAPFACREGCYDALTCVRYVMGCHVKKRSVGTGTLEVSPWSMFAAVCCCMDSLFLWPVQLACVRYLTGCPRQKAVCRYRCLTRPIHAVVRWVVQTTSKSTV